MHIFYTPDITTDTYTLNQEESKHAVRVLRVQAGERVQLTDGIGNLYWAEVTVPDQKRCGLQVISSEKNIIERPYKLHMAVAPTKNNDRFEWYLEKATEIGIDEITPIITHHSERKVVKPERLEKVIVAAMKQSIKAWKPVLNPLTDFNTFMQTQREEQQFIAHCYDSPKNTLKESCASADKLCILIGPEGDFSEAEVELAIKSGALPVSLGESRLRTETAALLACHTVNLMKG